jgi:GntR family transcriptional repressor for pyruvate dehydrogenase complex
MVGVARSRHKLSDDITNQILDSILSGRYEKQEYLPTEAELCRLYDVSRVTIRDAVRRLEERGLVKSMHGRGTRIINRTQDALASSVELMISSYDISLPTVLEVRKIVEVPLAKLAAQRASDEDIHELKVVLDKLKDEKTDKKTYIEEDLNFHLQIAKSSKNLLLQALLLSLRPILLSCIEQTIEDGNRPESQLHYHENIYEAIKSHNPDRAGLFMGTHLEGTEILALKKGSVLDGE